MQMKVWYGSNIPEYIILSHRWENEEDEVTLDDFESGKAERKHGYRKIEYLCRIARKYYCDWVWLDTCCIDKRNSVELGEAINSMYKWYQNSLFCVAYLFDFRADEQWDLSDSTWFKRCWTLQELIAPQVVRFYDNTWSWFGTKQSLRDTIAEITGVDRFTLSGADPRRCSVAQRMSWAAGREATRIEDQAYSLIGLFDLSLPMLYGDGEKAFLTLQKEILQTSRDQSIFAWGQGLEEGTYYGLLAKNVSAFAGCGRTRSMPPISKTHVFSFTGAGFQLNAPTIPCGMNTYLCPLDCTSGSPDDEERDCILLERSDEDDQYSRVCRDDRAIVAVKTSTLDTYSTREQRKMYVQQAPQHIPLSMVHGFFIRSVELPDYTVEEYRSIRWRSRDLGHIEVDSIPGVMAVPMLKWGTAGIIHFPQPRAIHDKHQIQCIKLGFDEHFRPTCLLSNNTTRSDSTMQAEGFFDNSKVSERERWGKDWLCTSADSPEDLRRFSGAWWFQNGGWLKDTHISYDLKSAQWGYCRFTCSLQDCPPEIKVGSLPRCGPGPWKIWTIDMRAVGSFYEDHQLRQQQRQKIQQRRQQRDNLFAMGVVVSAALTYKTVMDDRAKKKWERDKIRDPQGWERRITRGSPASSDK